MDIIKAIENGVKRAKCDLISTEILGDDVIFIVNNSNNSKKQIGKEYNFSLLAEKEIVLRVFRFCNHFVNKKPYHINLRDEFLESL